MGIMEKKMESTSLIQPSREMSLRARDGTFSIGQGSEKDEG